MELFKSEDLAEAVNSLSTKFSEKVRKFCVLCFVYCFGFLLKLFYLQQLDIDFEGWHLVYGLLGTGTNILIKNITLSLNLIKFLSNLNLGCSGESISAVQAGHLK